MAGRGKLNPVAAAAGRARDLKAVQIQGHAFGIDLDAVDLGHPQIGGEIIGAGLGDDEMVGGIGRTHVRDGRILQIDPRLDLLKGLKRRRGRAGRSEAALGKRGRRKRQGPGQKQSDSSKSVHVVVKGFRKARGRLQQKWQADAAQF